MTELQPILSPFAAITKNFEGNGPTLPGVVGALHFLRRKLVDDLGRFGSASQITNLPETSSEMPPPPTPSQRPQRRVQTPRHLDGYEFDLPSQRSTTSQALVDEPSIVVCQEEPNSIQLLRTSIRSAITKVEEYLDLLDDSHAYWFAMILYPGHRTRWMELHLEQHQVDSHIAAFKQCFHDQYAHQDILVDSQYATDNLESQETQGSDRFLTCSDYYDEAEDNKDEVDRYLSKRLKPVDKPLE